jgi:peptidase M15-like protein
VYWNLLWILSTWFSIGVSSGFPVASSDPTAATMRIPAAPDSSASVFPDLSMTSEAFDRDRAPFALTVGGERIPYRLMAAFALPDEEVPIEVSATDAALEVHCGSGILRAVDAHHWTWRAPATPGVYPITLGTHGTEAVRVNLIVMVPYSRMDHGVLGGYRIGEYPDPSARGKGEFGRPRGFVQVTALNETTAVSPHFQLRQFVCKEGNGYPKYLVLQSALLIKLERLLATVHENGIVASTFHVMSAYRTPVYNRGIGNVTTFSRHQYGDAADIFVDDHPRDGRMDDLNHDGKFDRRDAGVLRGWAEDLDRAPSDGVLVGGLSDYGPTPSHGPFVHVDARGYEARW